MKLNRRNLCQCGCGTITKAGRGYVFGHQNKGKVGILSPLFGTGKPKSSPQLCACGCGQMTNAGRIFINRHHFKAESFKVGLRERNTFQLARDAVAKSNSTRICKEETKEKHRINHSGDKNHFYGKHHSEKSLKIMRKPKSDSSKMGRYLRTKETIEKMSKACLKNWQNPEYKNKMVKVIYGNMNAKPNKPETFLINLLEELFPGEYKYTGDYSFTINGKSPDFTNINGQKKLIEFFGDYWHRGENSQDGIDIFKPYGWDTLVIWEKELKEVETLKRMLVSFHNKGNYKNV